MQMGNMGQIQAYDEENIGQSFMIVRRKIYQSAV